MEGLQDQRLLSLLQNEIFSNLSTSLKGSASRLGRMAQQGNKVAIFKLAGIISGVVICLWWIWSFFA